MPDTDTESTPAFIDASDAPVPAERILILIITKFHIKLEDKC